MKSYCGVHKICWVLVIVGALNWGLIGVFNFNLVMRIFGSVPMVERVIYILVGVAALCMLGGKKCCMGKDEKMGSTPAAPSAPQM